MGQCAILAVSALLAVWAVACASPSTDPTGPELPAERQSELVEAERLYRAGDPAFDAVRDRLAGDPATAYWVTRLFVYDIMRSWDAESASDETFLQRVAGAGRAKYEKPLAQLRALGPAAVPAISADLLHSRYGDRRQLGVEILAETGPQVVPALAPLLDDPDWRTRMLALRVAERFAPDPSVLALLAKGAEDAHFAVRAAALAALPPFGPEQVARARRALAEDADPFVRRSVAEALAAHPDKATAEALVAYYGDCVERDDTRGIQTADASLRRISGYGRSRDLAAWRAWLFTYASEDKR